MLKERLLQFSRSEMTQIHKRSKMINFVCFLSILDHIWFTSLHRFFPCWYMVQSSHFLSTEALASRIFMPTGQGYVCEPNCDGSLGEWSRFSTWRWCFRASSFFNTDAFVFPQGHARNIKNYQILWSEFVPIRSHEVYLNILDQCSSASRRFSVGSDLQSMTDSFLLPVCVSRFSWWRHIPYITWNLFNFSFLWSGVQLLLFFFPSLFHFTLKVCWPGRPLFWSKKIQVVNGFAFFQSVSIPSIFFSADICVTWWISLRQSMCLQMVHRRRHVNYGRYVVLTNHPDLFSSVDKDQRVVLG